MTKRKNNKKALILSCLCLLLCVSMLVGSTFAWFTDNATTNVNKIVSGKLDVQIVDKNGTEKTTELKFVNMNGSSDILWEPGATFRTEQFAIKNNGNLHLKFKVEVNTPDIAETGNELMEVIEFSMVDASNNTVTSMSDIALAPTNTSSYYAIQGTMSTEAGNAYMDKALEGITITVYAAQKDAEYDSDGNTYDANATYDAKPWADNASSAESDIKETGNVVEVYTAAGLAQFAKNVNVNGNNYAGKTVKLVNDIDLANGLWTPIGQTGATQFLGTFDGNGKTIYNLNVDSSNETGANYSSGLFGWIEVHTTGLTVIKDLTIDGAKVSGHHNVGAVAGYLIGTIESCHVKNATINCTHANDDACGDKAGALVGIVGAASAKVMNCTAANSTVTAGRDAGQVIGSWTTGTHTNCSAANVTVKPTGDCTGANINEAVVGRTN